MINPRLLCEMVAYTLLMMVCPALMLAPSWAGAETLIINEVLADPASDWDGDGAVNAKGDEWIEVMNVTDQPIDLSGWVLRDIAAETPDLRLEGVLDPGEAVVFYGSQAMDWQAENGLTASGFSLNNTGDVVQLLRAYEGTGGEELELMFAVSYDDHEAEDDRSCGFDLEQVEWLLFDALNPYGGSREPAGTGCAPSPHAPNACDDQVADESATFGEVKATYR